MSERWIILDVLTWLALDIAAVAGGVAIWYVVWVALPA